MDENFGGQPNPLSPKLNEESDSMNNSGPSMNPEMKQEVSQSFDTAPNSTQSTQDTNTSTMSEPMQSSQVNIDNPQGVNPIRPMEKAPEPVVEPPKKKKTGLILGVVFGAIALVLAVVLVILMMMNNSDPVAKAVNRVMLGQAPSNVAMDGKIEISTNSDSVGALSATIDLKSQGSISSLINTTSAEVNLNFKELGDMKFSIEELYPSNDDLYIKVNDIVAALTRFNEISEAYYNTVSVIEEGAVVEEDAEEIPEDYNSEPIDSELVVDGVVYTGASDMASVSNILTGIGGMLEQFDGKWIKVSLSDLKELVNGSVDVDIDCPVELVSDIKNSNNILSQIYVKNSFVFSTTKDVALAGKNGEVYQVVFDSEKMDAFMNEVNSTNFASNYKDCIQSDEDVFGLADLGALPSVYVELDNDYNFTRFYTTTNLDEDGETTLTADINFTYPTNINVSEPEGTVDFMEIVRMFVAGLYAEQYQ